MTTCPNCGSTNVTCTTTGGIFPQTCCTCADCGKTWCTLAGGGIIIIIIAVIALIILTRKKW